MLEALFKVSFTGEGQVGRMEWEERNGAGEHKTSCDTEKSDDDGFLIVSIDLLTTFRRRRRRSMWRLSLS